VSSVPDAVPAASPAPAAAAAAAAPLSNDPKHSADWNDKENAKAAEAKMEAEQKEREDAAVAAGVAAQKAQKEAMDKTAQESAQVAKDQAEKYSGLPGADQVPVPATGATPTSVDPGYDGTGCKTEECAHKARTAADKKAQKEEEAAEKIRVAEEEVEMAKASKKADADAIAKGKEIEKSADEAARAADEANKAAVADPIKARDWDPNVVCVSFNEKVKLDWCYAACTNGVCPPDAAADCMCAKGGDKEQKSKPDQQAKGAPTAGTGDGLPSTGTDWASGAKIPKAPTAPTATPAEKVDETSLVCAAKDKSVSAAWCTTTCKPAGGGIANCPEKLCSCEDTAARTWWSRYTSTNAQEPEKTYFGSRYEVSREMDLDSKEVMKGQLP